MVTEIEKRLKACLGCGQEYEAHIGHVMGITIAFGKGYCVACREKKREEEERLEAEKQARELSEKREQWRLECGIPRRFQDSRFAKFDTKVDKSIMKVWAECKGYADSFRFRQPQASKSLVLFSEGVWGIGKTYLVCSLAHAIIDRWQGEIGYCPVHFVSEPNLFLRVRATFNRRFGDNHAETEDEIYRHLTTVPLLILDDVGKEEVSDPRFVQRVLFAIIDGRYQNMLPMVITANLNPDGIERHLGGDRGNSASMDRLAEMTGNALSELKGESYSIMPSKITHFNRGDTEGKSP